ncbi:MAG: transglycosylase SLT domain-containing protein [Pyrinomonadaceae bacterium]
MLLFSLLLLGCVPANNFVAADEWTGQTTLSAPRSLAMQGAADDALSIVRRMDRADGRGADGTPTPLSAAEHLRRANIYLLNRAFDEARQHYQILIERYPNDPKIPAAIFGIGRSYFQARRYAESLPFFERLARDYATVQEGRDGLSNLGAALLRLGRADEAARRYIEYTERFPQGERIESSYLNVVDAYREADQTAEAINWIARTRARFPNSATNTNALFSRLRLDVATGEWPHAQQTADELRRAPLFAKGVATNAMEVAYLKAYSLERAGRLEEAVSDYLAIPDKVNSYYGAQATVRLLSISSATGRPVVTARTIAAENSVAASLYPAPYRETIARAARARNIDPRIVLAIMRQESNFRPRAKSNAAARGLLQLTIDTASKYAARAGYPNLRDEDLYVPEISIAVGSEYIGELARLFPNNPEAVIASYNGGEDNVARWMKRARQNDPGVFTSEIGFSETKDYVFKVMSNYRAYRKLYTIDLKPR